MKLAGGIRKVFTGWTDFANKNNLFTHTHKSLTLSITQYFNDSIFKYCFWIDIRYANRKAFLSGNLLDLNSKITIKTKEYSSKFDCDQFLAAKYFYSVLEDLLNSEEGLKYFKPYFFVKDSIYIKSNILSMSERKEFDFQSS